MESVWFSFITDMIDTEKYLLEVEQAPPESMTRAAGPAIAALVKKELLGHSNYNVKLGVISCISEITRITAPDTPYDDDVMKDVFSIMVGSFEKLDDMESPLFGRIVSILETVAKVRSCVVMLDLECDDLIQQMFHNFLSTVSSNHSETVITCMTTIMKLVIDESEEVQIPIAECLLQHAKTTLKETSTASFELSEKVIGECSEKLKPVFLQLLKGSPLNEYSNIVTSVCEDDSGVREYTNADPSGKDMVDDGKLSERTISDELPHESLKLDYPDQDVTQTTTVSGDATPDDNGTESVAANPKGSSNHGSDEHLQLKPSSTSESTAHSNVDTDKEALVASGVLSSETEVGIKKLSKVVSRPVDETPADSTPVMAKPRRGRPPGAKSSEKNAVRKNQSPGLKKVETTDSVGKLTKQSSKDDTKPSTRKAGEGQSSKKQQKTSLKQQKDETISKEDTAMDLSLKEMVSPKSVSKGSGRNKGQSQDNTGSKRKRSDEDEEIPRSRKNKGLDGSLVGSRIRVWWPDDKKFYKGVVDSFDTFSKRHKIAYDDGDVEVLLLRDEKWEFVNEEQEKTPDVASEISPRPRGRKGRRNSVLLEAGIAETPKSGGSDVPKKRGRPKGSSNGTPKSVISATTSKSKGKAASKNVTEIPIIGADLTTEAEKEAIPSTDKAMDDLPKEDSNTEAIPSTDKAKDDLPKEDSNTEAIPSTDKAKDDLPNEDSNNEAIPSTDKAKVDLPKEGSNKEAGGRGNDSKDETKSTEGKAKSGRKPKVAAAPASGEGSKANSVSADEEKLKETEGKAAEKEPGGSAGSTSTGKKRRRKA
ncbi:hypothetical protein GUJ93_ZPchr0006g41887 [Zizania palustris]|uniref:Tudor domain-containing protein n=1 Tax=Zizania palustris TaxID=103762 RepID=A0A8J5SZS1_ZIZPA|nr:hypothetical protein GUJ93_ZPchr0006g41887 [Zizania palustris]